MAFLRVLPLDGQQLNASRWLPTCQMNKQKNTREKFRDQIQVFGYLLGVPLWVAIVINVQETISKFSRIADPM
jgi:hypothetical protein